MRRYHLLELHEARWFPAPWRRLFLEGLGYTITSLRMYHHGVALLARLLQRVGARDVLDLCSGSAGPVLQLCRGTAAYGVPSPRVVLSDLYPNVARFHALRTHLPHGVDFCSQPVDARAVPNDGSVPRVRTILSALHHFQPDDVRKILTDAAHNADGVLALECTGRTWSNVVQILLTAPVSAAIITAFLLRPWRLRNVFYSLVFPVIPVTALVDSIVSTLRSYTPTELRAIVDRIDAPEFVWEVGTLAVPNKRVRTTYVMGWRRGARPSTEDDVDATQRTDAASHPDRGAGATCSVGGSG